MSILVGTAGWSLPAEWQGGFPAEGTHLQRYAARFGVAEINSSFHRSHRAATWAKWAESVPAEFRFSAKLPKTITHTARLVDADEPLTRFLDEAAGLGKRLACLLVQLPPSLEFDAGVAKAFFAAFRGRTSLLAACEPRHASWFGAEADALLSGFGIARVAADPAKVPEAAEPGGWQGLAYHRLHGSPRVYYSAYDDAYLAALAKCLRDDAERAETWCIFDNTASGAAVGNALALLERLGGAASTSTESV